MPIARKIYHIVHVDRIASIVNDGCLYCDAVMNTRRPSGTTIGMSTIKMRRLHLQLTSHKGLHVGECVPFYFCPRSVMLYLIYRGNHEEITYKGGQEPIIHLEADLHKVVEWANTNGHRWAFTLSNAGARYFEDRSDLSHLDEIDWHAVNATDWRDPKTKEAKQAEFLIERYCPWTLVERIGVQSRSTYAQVIAGLGSATHRPQVDVLPRWYY